MIRAYRGALPRLGQNVYIDEQACVIGDVELGDDASVWPMAVIRGDVNFIRIGARSNVQDGAVLHVTHDGPLLPGGMGLIVGDDVTIGHQAILHGCTVGSRCLIGMGAKLLDRAVIEDDVFIAAGALVGPGKRLQSGWLYRGSPAVQARRLSEQELSNLAYSAAHYVRVKNNYLQG
ncbi:MAG: gamma carbonic anhydrase family protein [Nevskia sp.]|nr:gamma carbonic anhydrase family protein [Nevskia sp.]